MKDKYNIIIRYFNNKESIRSITRRTKLHRETVTKDFSDSQKTYLSTLNTINKYLSENQN